MAESIVGVSPDGGGPKIRTLSINEQQADGTIQTVQMQVVSIANPDGSIVELDFDQEIVHLLRMQNAILRSISVQLSFLNSPRMSIPDLTMFMSDETLQ